MVRDLASWLSWPAELSHRVMAWEDHRRKMWIHCFCQLDAVGQSGRKAYAVATSVNVATVLVIVVDPVYTVETVVVEMGISLVSVLSRISKSHSLAFSHSGPLRETH